MKTTHPCEPGIPGWMTDLITSTAPDHFHGNSPIRWVCSYQGSSDYEYKGHRLQFRYGKTGWNCGPWNYKDEAEFNSEHNGNWGMLTRSNEPVDSETLDIFRKHHYPTATTGFYDHATHGWIECDPVRAMTDAYRPGYASWLAGKAVAA